MRIQLCKRFSGAKPSRCLSQVWSRPVRRRAGGPLPPAALPAQLLRQALPIRLLVAGGHAGGAAALARRAGAALPQRHRLLRHRRGRSCRSKREAGRHPTVYVSCGSNGMQTCQGKGRAAGQARSPSASNSHSRPPDRWRSEARRRSRGYVACRPLYIRKQKIQGTAGEEGGGWRGWLVGGGAGKPQRGGQGSRLPPH